VGPAAGPKARPHGKKLRTLALTTKTKLVLKGLNPDRFNAGSPDDPAGIAKVQAIAAELGVRV